MSEKDAEVSFETPFEKYVKTGLSDEEVARKLERYGPNELPERKTNPFRKFLGYFWGPIPWMIEVAARLSLVIQHWGRLLDNCYLADCKCHSWILAGTQS